MQCIGSKRPTPTHATKLQTFSKHYIGSTIPISAHTHPRYKTISFFEAVYRSSRPTPTHATFFKHYIWSTHTHTKKLQDFLKQFIGQQDPHPPTLKTTNFLETLCRVHDLDLYPHPPTLQNDKLSWSSVSVSETYKRYIRQLFLDHTYTKTAWTCITVVHNLL